VVSDDPDWQPMASIPALRERARIMARVRDYFSRHGVLEVETPILSAAASVDPNLHSLTAVSLAPGDAATPRYLQTSPEFAMKRLLAAGSGSIYQTAHVFRGGERGRRHNGEFTLLEWYRVDFDYHQLMDDVTALVTEALAGYRRLAAPEKLSYRGAFVRHVGVDPFTASASTLVDVARARNLQVSGIDADDQAAWRDLLLTHLVEPHLGRDRLTYIHDYPASQAALARVRPGNPPIAERFEVYLDGVELANGFQELTSAHEQRERFEADGGARMRRGLPSVPADRRLLAALAHGLPCCSGVALGLDRLVMLALGAASIDQVIAFPWDRA
jgi:elongation factor P--(R)-beta-lysine ligase